MDDEELDDNEAAEVQTRVQCLQLVILNFFPVHVNSQDSFLKMRSLIKKISIHKIIMAFVYVDQNGLLEEEEEFQVRRQQLENLKELIH
uniref:Uncharacterized protein n=1 Tax=Ditylenchus dipsaci TaxID=166011 RepID=A0A915EHB7_9BILA